MNTAVIPASRHADSLHTQARAEIPVDSTAVIAADSLTVVQIDSCTIDTTAEATRMWFTQGPLHLFYGDDAHPLFRTTDNAAEIFGTSAALIPPRAYSTPDSHPFTGNMVFQGAVLLLAITYIILLYRHLGDVVTVFGRIASTHATTDRASDNQGVTGFSLFLNIAGAVGLLFIGIAVVKAGDLLLPPDFTEMLPSGIPPIMPIAAIFGCLVLAAYQSTIVHLAGAVTRTQPFIAQLMFLKRIYFVLMVLVTTPALLFFALCPPGTGMGWAYLIAVQLVITTVLYLWESLNLFLSKKISILHWFLYLCTVEIFPISLLWLASVR